MIDSPEFVAVLNSLRWQIPLLAALTCGILCWGMAGLLRIRRDYIDELRIRQTTAHLGRVNLGLAAAAIVASLTVVPLLLRALTIAGRGSETLPKLLAACFLPAAWPGGRGWAPLGLLFGSAALWLVQEGLEGRRGLRWHAGASWTWMLASAAGLLSLVARAWMTYPGLTALVRH